MQSLDLTGSLFVSIKNTIATIEFGHPASNSLPSELLYRLTTEIQDLSNNSEVSVIILKSSGIGVFCAGASFDELLLVSNLDEATKFFSGFAHVLNAMRSCSKIIIGRIQGKTVGGGVGIIAACNYALGTVDSNVKLSELSIGIGPFVIEPAVSRKIGKAAMTEMALNPKQWKSANWAVQKGLFIDTFETIELLDEAVASLASEFASYNNEALLEIKKILWEGTDHWESLLFERAAISGKLVLTDFTKNALRQLKK